RREKTIDVRSKSTRRVRGRDERAPRLRAANRAGIVDLHPTNIDALVEQLRAIESARRDGLLQLPGGDTLKVTNLHKLFWPKQKLTKGDLFRYYVRAAPFICPAVADRPLVM